MGKRTTSSKKAPAAGSAIPPAPAGMLALLLAAFAGALGLKAFDERRADDRAQLSRVYREAETAAGSVRADLMALRARMEGARFATSSLDSVRRATGLDAVTTQPAPDEAWAYLEDNGAVRVFAQSADGESISGLRTHFDLLPENGGAYLSAKSPIADGAVYAQGADGRRATACSAIPGAAFSVCVDRPAPLVTTEDLYRAFIYLLVLAAPVLAVTGLMQVVGRARKAADAQARDYREALEKAAKSRDFELPGILGSWKWDPVGRMLILGRVASQMLGQYAPGSMPLEELLARVPETERRKVEGAFLDADPFSDLNLHFQIHYKGAIRYFEMIGGAFDGGLAGAVLDVTDRVSAQSLSRRAEVVARTAIDAHPGPFAVWDQRKRLTHWNTAFVRIFNLEPNVMHVGASFDYVMAEVSRNVRVERPLGDDSNAREMLLATDRWVRVVDRRTANEGMITVGVDITNLKAQESGLMRSEKRLKSMVTALERTRGQAQELAHRYAEEKANAERASQAKSVFLANMSHELRTPLNAINGFSEMIVNEVYGPLGDERYKGYAGDILESGQHLLDMINDILDMAKIEAGKMQITPRPIDPTDAVDAAIRLIRRRAADRQVSLTYDQEDDLPEIQGDHRAIKQMTLNLLANAIKFTDPGGKIKVDVKREGDMIAISVADTGIGIPASDLPRLAQPFEQARAPEGRNPGGTGLGLALTKSFAEMHGGRLGIESTLGVGTTVTIYLPVTPADSARRDDPESRRAAE
ncbi:MAG: PAS domain-containing sensor histidine kinase [Hyphomonadaceae bacterium]